MGAARSIASCLGKACSSLIIWFSWQVPSAFWPQAEPQRYPVPPPGGILSILRAPSAWKVLVYWFLQFQSSVCWGLELMNQVSFHSDPCPRGVTMSLAGVRDEPPTLHFGCEIPRTSCRHQGSHGVGLTTSFVVTFSVVSSPRASQMTWDESVPPHQP